ncbi:MAG: M20 family metallopeptidase [Desulfurococcaceae archaeon]
MFKTDEIDIAVKILVDSLEYKTTLGEDYEEIIKYYADVLSSYGVHVTIHRVPQEYVRKNLHQRYNPDKPRYILIARVGCGDRILQFNGHYDVVPPGEGWQLDPFKPTIIDTKIYGRGASDMKGGIATFLATLIHFARREPEIILEGVLVPDEEIGGVTGTGYLIKELESKPDWAIIAEPSGLDNVWIGHRGIAWFMVKIFGKQAHGSAPWLGENAFEKMLIFAKQLIEKYRDQLSRKRSSFSYDDPNAITPTITPGGMLLSPGAINIVPGEVGFSIDRRLIIEEKVDEVVDEFTRLVNEISRETGIISEVEVVNTSNPAFTPLDSLLVEAITESIMKTINIKPKHTVCTGGLDLRYYTDAKIEAVAYGPGIVNVAHKANEYIDINDIRRGIEVYISIVKNLEERAHKR